ncbi:hypothetical protein C0Q70_08581 [Pomacea canaliculata]|uniref:C3H1-type domain-containing protein n=2 Tax=Pomacea canaliculata TaxID=400727 RepID=A0A2T7PI91_POMCA|nr:hypothetical protein C0Q70_08581 [Pomacea canaliculata]
MTILAEEAAKRPCLSFFQTGNCNFGDGCRFSHLTEERKQHLEAECLRKKHEKRKGPSEGPGSSLAVGFLEDWLAKRSEAPEKNPTKKHLFPSYRLPQILENIPHIPPSLLPPTREDFENLPRLEWG